MKLRSSFLLLPLVAALSVGTLAPAQAAPTDPVTNLTVSVVQAPGSNTSWKVSAAWTANPEATSYSVVIADQADGTVSAGKSYGNKDTAATSADLTTDNLLAGQTYWVAVRPLAPALGTVVTSAFVPPALDTTAPNGSYKLNRTTAFLRLDAPFENNNVSAPVTITQNSVDPGTVTRSVIAGDGSAAKAWTAAKPYQIVYKRAGTFAPKVRLVDQFGNSRDVALPAVSVRADKTPPGIKIVRPAKPTKKASWKVIRGTASDAGVGLEAVGILIAEQRGKTWWTYDFRSKKWLKGKSSLTKTLDTSRANPAFVTPTSAGTWKSPAIKGITKGVLFVSAVALDKNVNGRVVDLKQKVS